MELSKIIKYRRSCRCFLDTPVEKEKIETILKAGILAPTAHNLQPFKFYVSFGEKKYNIIKEIMSELKDKKKIAPQFSGAIRSARIMKNAPVNIYVLMEENEYISKNTLKIEDINDKVIKYIMEQNLAQNTISVGTAIENMLLTANDIGLGAICISEICYAMNFSLDYFSDIKGKKYRLISSMAIGYEDKDLIGQKSKRKSFDEMVIYAE